MLLIVNENVPGLYERAHSDPLLYSLVYPEVVRHVLTRTIMEDLGEEEDDDRWPALWLKFGQNLHSSQEKAPDRDMEEEWRDWVDDVVDNFCTTHRLMDKYTSIMPSEPGENT